MKSIRLTPHTVVGYQDVEIPANGFYVFTPTFKGVGTTKTFDIKTITPKIATGATVSKDQKISLYVLDSEGNYGLPIYWYGTASMWTKDGTNPIEDNEVVVGDGMGVAVNNIVRVNSSTGDEVAKGGVYGKAYFQVSGEVDLTCQNKVAAGVFQISGNSTPVEINLKKITPKTAGGATVANDQKVAVFMLGLDGNYGLPIYWYGSLGFWTTDGVNEISDEDGVLAAGQGFAVQNIVRVNATTGAEVKKGGVYGDVYLCLPSPVTAE